MRGWAFWDSVPKRSHFQSKNLYCRFWTLIQGFKEGFSEKLQYKIPNLRGGWKAVWNFSENSSVLVLPPIPKSGQKDENKERQKDNTQYSEEIFWLIELNNLWRFPKMIVWSRELHSPLDDLVCNFVWVGVLVLFYHFYLDSPSSGGGGPSKKFEALSGRLRDEARFVKTKEKEISKPWSYSSSSSIW